MRKTREGIEGASGKRQRERVAGVEEAAARRERYNDESKEGKEVQQCSASVSTWLCNVTGSNSCSSRGGMSDSASAAMAKFPIAYSIAACRGGCGRRYWLCAPHMCEDFLYSMTAFFKS